MDRSLFSARSPARADRQRQGRAIYRRDTSLCAVGRRLRPGPRVWSPPGEGQGAGACQPLAPYNPLPRLRQPSLTGIISPQLIPFSPLPAARHRASPFRCPARGTSVRAAAELPPLRGGDLRRAMPRLRHQTGWPEALEAEKHHAEWTQAQRSVP